MPDIQRIYQAALVRGPDELIDASLVEAFVESPFGVYCELFAQPEERDPLGLYQQLLFKRGQEHESTVVKQEYPDAGEEPFETEEEGFRKTLEMMERGVSEIHSMPLLYLPAGMRGRPDVLVKTSGGRSHFGKYHYEVVEIKLAKNLRRAHEVQGAFYTRLIGLIQGFTSKQFHIVNGESKVLPFVYAQCEPDLDEAITGVRAVLNGKVVEPCYGSCRWPWENYGNRLAVENRDVSLIPGVGLGLQAGLKAGGFITVDDVAGTKPPKLLSVKGIGAVRAEDFYLKAKAITSQRPIRRPGNALAFRRKKYELFLDLEGTDPRFNTEGLAVTNYLIGVVTRNGRGSEYAPFVAPTPADEERMLREFCRYVTSLSDYVIYHWHNYERVHLERMLEYYGISLRASSRILNHLVDLRPIATKSFAFPCYSDGLKSIASCLGFQWRQEDVDALTSVVLYLRYVRSGGTEKDAITKIMTYNEDDCRATMFIKDWLVERS